MPSTSGSVQGASTTLIRFYTKHGCDMTAVNAHSGTIYAGQEVVISANGSVVPRGSAASVVPHGVAMATAATGEQITVRYYGSMYLKGIAKGSTLTAGSTVRQDATTAATPEADIANVPNFVAATTANDIATGVVLTGGTVGKLIEVIVFNQPIKI